MLLVFCSACFGVLFCSLVLGCRYIAETTGPCSQWCHFFNWVCLSMPLHTLDLWQYYLCMLYKIRCNPMHPLYGAQPGPYVPVRVTRGAVIAHRCTYLPSSLQNLAVRQDFFPCQYLCGTILVGPYSLVWDWRVKRAGPSLLLAQLLAQFLSLAVHPVILIKLQIESVYKIRIIMYMRN